MNRRQHALRYRVLRLRSAAGLLALACGAADDRPSAMQLQGTDMPSATAPEGVSPPTDPGAPAAPAVNGSESGEVPTELALPPAEGGQVGAATCTDVPPNAQFTCAEQVGWGKCSEPWMQNNCNASCGRCVVSGGAPGPMQPNPVLEPPAGAVVPVVPNASRQAQNLLNYLYQQYGVRMLSGQMESTWMPGGADYEIDYVERTTGRLPAVRGLDFIQYNGVVQRALDWWERGGIVNIRWHWGAPTRGQGYDASQEEVDIDRVLTPGTAEYQSMIAGLDRTATDLARLRDAGVPVLWTPFHELNGDWFWWGKGTPAQFIALWRFMFDYFTETKGLNNLIWVLGYTGQPDADWYPGREYVDIAGADSYARNEQPQLGMFNAVRGIVGMDMPVTYHECGIIPNPSLAREQGAMWSWFMTWHTDWLTEENSVEHLQQVYADDFVITLDELPNLR